MSADDEFFLTVAVVLAFMVFSGSAVWHRWRLARNPQAGWGFSIVLAALSVAVICGSVLGFFWLAFQLDWM